MNAHPDGALLAFVAVMAILPSPPIKFINVLYRWVEVGQASVVMAISSPHRHDGQQAVQHCINQLKAKIPIWKKVRTLKYEEPWLSPGFYRVAIHLSTGSL